MLPNGTRTFKILKVVRWSRGLDPTALAAALKARALEEGADLAGIAAAVSAVDGPAYDAWVAAGMHGGMAYMARNAESRRDVRAWFAPAKSVLVCSYSYGGASPKRGAGGHGRIAGATPCGRITTTIS